MLDIANESNKSNGKENKDLKQESQSDKSLPLYYKKKIKCKQIHLLMLRHASMCTHKEGECPFSATCSKFQVLWKHINKCNDDECKIKHCFQSRRLMSHYCQCVDVRCLICIPVRKTFETNKNQYHSCLSSIKE